jgi:hypothetical protein
VHFSGYIQLKPSAGRAEQSSAAKGAVFQGAAFYEFPPMKIGNTAVIS